MYSKLRDKYFHITSASLIPRPLWSYEHPGQAAIYDRQTSSQTRLPITPSITYHVESQSLPTVRADASHNQTHPTRADFREVCTHLYPTISSECSFVAAFLIIVNEYNT